MSETWTDEQWQDGRDRVREEDEYLHGPVVAHFTINEVASRGDHPLNVREAWRGVPLPVRQRFAEMTPGVVKVLCSDGFNALVEAGIDESVLQYWIDLLDGRADSSTTFDFSQSDGEYTELANSSPEQNDRV